jgi:regulator of sirC expression with transglutaminase-like and TPR domain
MLDDNNLKALVSLLSDDDPEVLNHIQAKIISLGTEMIPLLEREWENNFNPHVQKRIVDLIHTIQFGGLKTKLSEWKDAGGKDLLEGMWLVATYQYPDLDFHKLKTEFDQLFYEAWTDLQLESNPADTVKILNNVVFGKLKFSANTKNFHSPSNSMINNVLESRKGNPIALCVVYLMFAQKLKLPIYGVNLPNLFILTYKTEANDQFYINAFNKGLIFSKADIDNYISHLNLTPNPIYFDPCDHIDIVARVFRNLIVSFEKIGEAEKVKEVKDLLTIVDRNGNVGYA